MRPANFPKGVNMTNSEVRELIQYACDMNGRPDIAKLIRVKWSNRMTRAMGIASKRGEDNLIKLSIPLFLRATEEQKWQTVIHEACHIIDAVKNSVRMSHGRSWKKCMEACEVKPDVYHTVSCEGLRRRWSYHCPDCKRGFELSTTIHNKICRGQVRICLHCRTKIERGKA